MTPRRKAFGRPSGELFADLHLHSNQSDGTDAPAAVAHRVASEGLKAFALTDHDTTSGNDEAGKAAEKVGIIFLPGIEISAECAGIEVHILGLGIREEEGELEEKLKQVRLDRMDRVKQMGERLRDLGVPLNPEAIEAEIGDARAPGRLHVARALYTIGVTKNTQEAFTKFIGIGKPAYVPKQRMPAQDAIALIQGKGGIAAIAHPGIGGVQKKLNQMLALPFDGIEVWHPEHNAGQCELFAMIATENGLIATGGSDDHGSKTERRFMGQTGLNETAFRAVENRLVKT